MCKKLSYKTSKDLKFDSIRFFYKHHTSDNRITLYIEPFSCYIYRKCRILVFYEE